MLLRHTQPALVGDWSGTIHCAHLYSPLAPTPDASNAAARGAHLLHSTGAVQRTW